MNARDSRLSNKPSPASATDADTDKISAKSSASNASDDVSSLSSLSRLSFCIQKSLVHINSCQLELFSRLHCIRSLQCCLTLCSCFQWAVSQQQWEWGFREGEKGGQDGEGSRKGKGLGKGGE